MNHFHHLLSKTNPPSVPFRARVGSEQSNGIPHIKGIGLISIGPYFTNHTKKEADRRDSTDNPHTLSNSMLLQQHTI